MPAISVSANSIRLLVFKQIAINWFSPANRSQLPHKAPRKDYIDLCLKLPIWRAAGNRVLFRNCHIATIMVRESIPTGTVRNRMVVFFKQELHNTPSNGYAVRHKNCGFFHMKEWHHASIDSANHFNNPACPCRLCSFWMRGRKQ